MTLDELTQLYEGAWNATGGVERRRLMDQCWADDGVFAGTETHAVGREAIAAHIDRFRKTYPAARVTVREMRELHGALLIRIHVVLDSERQGSVIDVAERADDGRLKRVIVFPDTATSDKGVS